MATKASIINKAIASGVPQKSLSPGEQGILGANLDAWARLVAEAYRFGKQNPMTAVEGLKRINIQIDNVIQDVMDDQTWIRSLRVLQRFVRQGINNPQDAVGMCERSANYIASMRMGLKRMM